MVRRDSSQMPHLPSSCKMLITCFHFQTTFTFLKKQGFLLKECFVAPFQMIVAETIQTVGPNKRLRNFPLEEKVACEARTFPCPNPSHLLGVGKELAEFCKTVTSCVKLARCPHRWAWFSHLGGRGWKEVRGVGRSPPPALFPVPSI